jgi:hypothetical protein
MKGRSIFQSLAEILRIAHHDVERQIGNGVTEMSNGAANAASICNGVSLDMLDNEQVYVAVGGGLAVGVGTEKDDFFGLELFDEHLEVRAQLIGDLVDRIARVSEHVLADVR